MKNIFYILCGIKYGSTRQLYNSYITYDYSLNAYLVWISRYDVCTLEDVCIGVFYSNVESYIGWDAYAEACKCRDSFMKVPTSIEYHYHSNPLMPSRSANDDIEDPLLLRN